MHSFRTSISLAIISCFLCAVTARAEVKYVDASTLTIIGKSIPGKVEAAGNSFKRVEGFDFQDKGLNTKAAYPTGLAVLFKTNSTVIHAKWKTGSACPVNMTAAGQKGLDLYILRDGNWRYAGVGKPVMKDRFTDHNCVIVKEMDGSEKECILYLPLYDRLDSLFIGIDRTAEIEPIGNPFDHKIIFGGSSITQGAAAGRPGLSYSGLMEIRHGLYCCNLGFSGQFKLQKRLAQYMAEIKDVDAFIFDAFSNPSAEEIENRFDAFMDTLRKAHPLTPVFFLQTENREIRNFNTAVENFEAKKQAAARKCVNARMQIDPNLYFIDSKDFLPITDFSTTDGTHPNDYAMIKTVDIVAPIVKKVIETKYDPRVEELLTKMTLEEKIGQMNLVSTKGDITGPTGGKDPRAQIRAGLCGNVLNAVGIDYIGLLQKIAVEESRLGIPLLFGYDEIHGQKTIFPICLGESCTWDLGLIERSARVGASEAAANGLNWIYNPMVDVSWDARWGRVSEGAGEDPWYGAKVARARVHGVQGENLADPLTVAACVKHYGGYGASEAGRDYNTVDMSELRFREFFLPPYKAAIDAGVKSVMTSFNELNGIPATGNTFLLRTLLKGEMGFKGFVVTDSNSLGEMVFHGYSEDISQASMQAIDAGVDMDMASSSYINHLARLVKSGKVSISLINDAVRRILQVKCDLGLFDDPYRYIDRKRAEKITYCKANQKVALEEARASMVLLKNENGVLPLKKNEKIALIGELATSARHYLGSWPGKGEKELTETIFDVFKKQLGTEKFIYAEGCSLNGQGEDDFTEAVKAAEQADKVVLLMGEPYNWSGEAKCRTDIRLPENQFRLLEKLHSLGKPVAVALMNGRPLDLTREDAMASALLECWYPGTMAAEALFDVLYGHYNPSGHLTMSFPRSIGQLPFCYYGKSTGRPIGVKSNINFTSRYIDCPNTPLYPFGYGLSYTEFSYSPIDLSSTTMTASDNITATVTVTNTGKVAGETVVQLYLRDLAGSVTRPVKMLRGFEKIALKPGESRAVKFTINEEMLKFWRSDMTYGSEPGKFHLFIGPDSSVSDFVEFTLEAVLK